ncbi:MAG: hypothetical protein Ta2A_09800 [Treponemataceae bacterium]|nr:MAG: hypothetical protein Ta2A_09800 [Treponemataceae bacterium]
MKKFVTVFFCVFLGVGAFCDEAESEQNGIVSLKNESYIFNILVVDDLEKTEVLEDFPVGEAMPVIEASSTANIDKPFSLYLGFASLAEDADAVDLSYDLKVQKPDGTFVQHEYNHMVIAREKVQANVFRRGDQTVTMVFDSDDDAGKYQFYVDIYDGQKIIDECVMSVNLVK